MRWTSRGARVLAGAVVTIVVVSASAQDQPPPADSEAPRLPIAMRYPEIMQAQRALMRLMSEAFRIDEGLHELRAEFEEAQRKAMEALDPQTTQRLERLSELQAMHDDIVANQEFPDVDALLAEGRQLRRALQATAAEARRRPEVAKRASTLASALEARFQQIDPESFQLLAQHDRWIEAVWAALLVSP